MIKSKMEENRMWRWGGNRYRIDILRKVILSLGKKTFWSYFLIRWHLSKLEGGEAGIHVYSLGEWYSWHRYSRFKISKAEILLVCSLIASRSTLLEKSVWRERIVENKKSTAIKTWGSYRALQVHAKESTSGWGAEWHNYVQQGCLNPVLFIVDLVARMGSKNIRMKTT